MRKAWEKWDKDNGRNFFFLISIVVCELEKSGKQTPNESGPKMIDWMGIELSRDRRARDESTGKHQHMCVLVAQLCSTLCNPMDSSPPGSSVHQIFQARIPEWIAIPFPRSSAYYSVQSLSHIRLFATPWTARQVTLSITNIYHQWHVDGV